MTQLVIYPRLYQCPVKGSADALVRSRGDQSVAALYRIYEAGMQDTRNLDFRLKVWDCAMRLFGDFREWMQLQRGNANIIGYNLEFLRDTLKYITQGTRELSPLTWLDLLTEKSEHSAIAHHLTLPELAIPANVSTAEIIQLWCSHKNGFDDLLQTLFVLFGAARGENR